MTMYSSRTLADTWDAPLKALADLDTSGFFSRLELVPREETQQSSHAS